MTRVREATPADEPRLRAIQATALADPWPEILDAGLDGPALVLAVEDGPVVGYAAVVADGTVAYVAEFAVAPAHQRQGYGSALMAAVLERLAADGHGTVRLTVRADDDGARSFYDTHGFAVHERVADHYADGTDGLVLTRTLP